MRSRFECERDRGGGQRRRAGSGAGAVRGGGRRRPLPFADGEFDALVCIDAINHLDGRGRVLADWCRVVRPGGQILFTDPIIVTGLLTSKEIAARSAIGFFVFSLLELDRALIRAAGLELVREEDLTGAVANVSRRWRGARERYREQLVAAEDGTRLRTSSASSTSCMTSRASGGCRGTCS